MKLKKLIAFTTAVSLSATLFQNAIIKKANADEIPMPDTPVISSTANRSLNIEDTTDWAKTHTISKKVNILDYIDASKTNTFTGDLEGTIKQLVNNNENNKNVIFTEMGGLFIGNDNNIYISGYNYAFHLDPRVNIGYYTKTQKMNSLKNSKIKQISTSGNNTFILYEDGTVYGWGENNALINSENYGSGCTSIVSLTNNFTDNKIIKIDAQYNHIAYLDEYGNLYTNSILNNTTLTKMKFPNDIKIANMAGGTNFEVCTDTEGNLYTFGGKNSYGQLGTNNTNSSSTPILIELPSKNKVKQFDCGDSFTACVDTDGNLFTWGNNSYYQLGDGTNKNKLTPTKIELPTGNKVESVSCGKYFMIVKDVEGKYYGCGKNSYKQLGFLGSTSQITTLTEIPKCIDGDIKYIQCSYEGTLIVDTNNKAYACGANQYYNLGTGTKENVINEIKFPEGVKIADEYISNSNESIARLSLNVTIPSNTKLSNINFELSDTEGNTYSLTDCYSAKITNQDGTSINLLSDTDAIIPSGTYNLVFNCMAGNKTSENWTLNSLTANAEIIEKIQNFDRIEYSIDNSDFKTYDKANKPKLNRYETTIVARTYNTNGTYAEETKTFNEGITKEQCTPKVPTILQSKNMITIQDNTDWTLGNNDGLYQSIDKIQYKFSDSNEWHDYTDEIDITGHKGDIVAKIINTDGLNSEQTYKISYAVVDGTIYYLSQSELCDKVEELTSKAESSYETSDIVMCNKYLDYIDDETKKTSFTNRLNTVSATINTWIAESNTLLEEFKNNHSISNFNKLTSYHEKLPNCSTKASLKNNIENAISDVFDSCTKPNTNNRLSNTEIEQYINYLSKDNDKITNVSKLVTLYNSTYDEDDCKAATLAVNLLKDGIDKENFQNKINEITTLINTWETKCNDLVDNLGDTPNFDDIQALRDYIDTLPNSPTKTKYEKIANDVISTFLTGELSSTETTLTNDKVNYLYTKLGNDKLSTIISNVLDIPNLNDTNSELIDFAINLITDDDTKNTLLTKHKLVLDKYVAQTKVEIAESTYILSDIEDAYNSVNPLPESTFKTSLLKRLEKVTNTITKWDTECKVLIDSFKNNPTKAGLDLINNYIDTLPNCDEKTTLKTLVNSTISEVITDHTKTDSTRLNAETIKTMLEIYQPKENAYTLVEKFVNLANDTYSKEDLKNAQTSVSTLDDDSRKQAFNTVIEEIQNTLTTYEDTVNDYKNLLKAEPRVDTFKELYDYIENIRDCETKEQFKNEYNKMAKDYIKDQLTSNNLNLDDLNTLTSFMTQEDIINFIENLINSSNIKKYDKDAINKLLDLVTDETIRNNLQENYINSIKDFVSPTLAKFDITANSITISWSCNYQAFNAPTKYQVAIDEITSRDIGNLTWKDINIDTTSYTFENLNASCSYRVYIRACYGNKFSTPMSKDVITKTEVKPTPDDDKPQTPEDVIIPSEGKNDLVSIKEVTKNSATINISDVCQTYESCEAALSEESFDDTDISTLDWIPVEDNTVEFNELENETTYTVFVKVLNEGVNNIYYKNFTTTASEIDNPSNDYDNNNGDNSNNNSNNSSSTNNTTSTTTKPNTKFNTKNTSTSTNNTTSNKAPIENTNNRAVENKTFDPNKTYILFIFLLSLGVCIVSHRVDNAKKKNEVE